MHFGWQVLVYSIKHIFMFCALFYLENTSIAEKTIPFLSSAILPISIISTWIRFDALTGVIVLLENFGWAWITSHIMRCPKMYALYTIIQYLGLKIYIQWCGLHLNPKKPDTDPFSRHGNSCWYVPWAFWLPNRATPGEHVLWFYWPLYSSPLSYHLLHTRPAVPHWRWDSSFFLMSIAALERDASCVCKWKCHITGICIFKNI